MSHDVDYRGIDTSARIGADLDVGLQTQGDGLAQLGSKGLLAFLEATREVGHAAAPRYIPITMGPQRLPHLAEDGDRSCLNLMHAIERRAAVDARPERVKLGQESGIQLPWNARIDEERLDFRGEQN